MPNVIWQDVPLEWKIRFFLVQGLPELELALWCLAIISVVCVLVGFQTRIFGIVGALLLYHLAPLEALLSVPMPWGKGLTIATLALVVLSCAPCEDRWSMASPRTDRPTQSYGWAVMLIRLFFAQIYLFSVAARLQYVGWDWAKLETVRNHILVFRLAEPSLDTPFNAFLDCSPATLRLFSRWEPSCSRCSLYSRCLSRSCVFRWLWQGCYFTRVFGSLSASTSQTCPTSRCFSTSMARQGRRKNPAGRLFGAGHGLI